MTIPFSGHNLFANCKLCLREIYWWKTGKKSRHIVLPANSVVLCLGLHNERLLDDSPREGLRILAPGGGGRGALRFLCGVS